MGDNDTSPPFNGTSGPSAPNSRGFEPSWGFASLLLPIFLSQLRPGGGLRTRSAPASFQGQQSLGEFGSILSSLLSYLSCWYLLKNAVLYPVRVLADRELSSLPSSSSSSLLLSSLVRMFATTTHKLNHLYFSTWIVLFLTAYLQENTPSFSWVTLYLKDAGRTIQLSKELGVEMVQAASVEPDPSKNGSTMAGMQLGQVRRILRTQARDRVADIAGQFSRWTSHRRSASVEF